MSVMGMSVDVPAAVWIIAALWTAVVVYVVIDVRRVMARNNRANAKLFGFEPGPITARGVLINRIALVVMLIAGDWAILRFGARLLGPAA